MRILGRIHHRRQCYTRGVSFSSDERIFPDLIQYDALALWMLEEELEMSSWRQTLLEFCLLGYELQIEQRILHRKSWLLSPHHPLTYCSSLSHLPILAEFLVLETSILGNRSLHFQYSFYSHLEAVMLVHSKSGEEQGSMHLETPISELSFDMMTSMALSWVEDQRQVFQRGVSWL